MLRGDVPLLAMTRACSSWLKATAILLFGRFFVPTVPYTDTFFLEQSRMILSSVKSSSVCLLGGTVFSLAAMHAVYKGLVCESVCVS
jgi:hypothetical protein